MPIERCTLPNGEGQGWRWGQSGTCYRDRADAEKQTAAAHANGFTGDAEHWITAHPNGPHSDGTPLLIEGEGGNYKIKGGAGGKLTGKEVKPSSMSNARPGTDAPKPPAKREPPPIQDGHQRTLERHKIEKKTKKAYAIKSATGENEGDYEYAWLPKSQTSVHEGHIIGMPQWLGREHKLATETPAKPAAELDYEAAKTAPVKSGHVRLAEPRKVLKETDKGVGIENRIYSRALQNKKDGKSLSEEETAALQDHAEIRWGPKEHASVENGHLIGMAPWVAEKHNFPVDAEAKAQQQQQKTARTYLRVPFEKKDVAKAAGAKWDADKRQWFWPGGEMPEKLRGFAPGTPGGGSAAPQRRALPMRGRINEDDPSVWGHELLGWEGEPWSAFWASPQGARIKANYEGTDVPAWAKAGNDLSHDSAESGAENYDLSPEDDGSNDRSNYPEDDMTIDAFALDRASVREVDQDGHMHISESPISKAGVNPYRGNEIPGWQSLGLDPNRIYQLLRDPEELEKAAATFEGKPLHESHRPQTANDHDKQPVVGSVNNVRWDAPYLKAALHVWDGDAIDGIKSNEQREVSSGYRYDPDMTPGVFEGTPYDGIMRNIRGNHVALVSKGRAGPDVVVGDQALKTMEINHMAIAPRRLSPRAAAAYGALTAHLAPRLAQDARLDVRPILAGVTSRTWPTDKPRIAAALRAALAGKLAQDAEIGDLVQLLDKLDGLEPDGDEAAPPIGSDGDRSAEIKAILGDNASPEIVAKLCALLNKPAAEDDAPAKPMMPGQPAPLPAKTAKDETQEGVTVKNNDGNDDVNKEKPVTQAAMDAAISAAVVASSAALLARMQGLDVAREAVRPHIGAVAVNVAQDSAATVYRMALDHFRAEGHPVNLDGVPDSALAAVFASIAPLVQQAARRPAPAPHMAADSASVNDFNKRFLGAKLATVIG